jgi:multidrug efflux system outer membrane protein
MNKMKRNPVNIILILSLSLLAGCMVGKQYSTPQPPAPGTIVLRDGKPADTTALMKWFDLYQDPVLQNMIRATLDSNLDLLTAASRIEEARLQTAVIKTNMLPRVDYTIKAGGGYAGTEAGKVAGGVDGGLLNAFGGVISWEADIWGKYRSLNKAALARYLGETENRNAVVFSLVSEVASLYFLLRDLDNRLAISQQTLIARKESTRIISERFQKGYTSQIDELLAIQQENFAAAVIPSIQRQVIQTENALRLLMGMGPGTVSRGLSNFDQNLTPDIPVGLPSQLLERRPDIRAAEKALNAQFETINVAQANRFPNLSITGLLGFASPQLSTLISGGFVANGFAQLTGPLFNFNRNKNIVEIEKQRTQQVMYQYRQTVLSAFIDVDNALSNYRTYVDEYDAKKKQVDAAEKSLQLYRAKYDNGYTSYLEVTVQETNLLDAQLQLSLTQQGKLNSIVQLYKALGGGWE